MYPINLLEEVFERALEQLFQTDSYLIARNISERSICGRLALYLHETSIQNEIQNYYVDIEYNRNQNNPYMLKTIEGRDGALKITCDLVLHSRGTMEIDNLIAIEMKKSNRPKKEKDKDRDRLEKLTSINCSHIRPEEHVYGYQVGYYLEFNIKKRTYLLEKYIGGELTCSRSDSF